MYGIVSLILLISLKYHKGKIFLQCHIFYFFITNFLLINFKIDHSTFTTFNFVEYLTAISTYYFFFSLSTLFLIVPTYKNYVNEMKGQEDAHWQTGDLGFVKCQNFRWKISNLKVPKFYGKMPVVKFAR